MGLNRQSKTGPKGVAGLALAGLLSVGWSMAGGHAAQAQSAYGCHDLVGSDVIPSVEGDAGQFFPVVPDLLSFHGLADSTVEQVADLSERLLAQGTMLIYVPLPTKAMVLPQRLPPIARHLGYDPELAATVYDDTRMRLTDAGVRTLDARQALRRVGLSGSDPYFGTDLRLNLTGVQALVQSMNDALSAAPGFDALPKTPYRNIAGAAAPVPSLMTRQLQDECSAALPAPEMPRFDTVPAIGGGDTALFPGAVPSGRIVLVGSDVVLDPALNTAGFLAESTGLNVEARQVPDDTGLVALSDLVMSEAFQASRPAYLIWVQPIWQSLAGFGDAPLTALRAAASMDCPITVPLGMDADPMRLRADLLTLSGRDGLTLMIETGGVEATSARFGFGGPGGMVRTRSVFRQSGQGGSARFAMPLQGLWPEGAQSVEITLDVPFGPSPRLMACR